MIVRQRLEWSLGVHVRLARVSCGATLPIPDCLQTVTSYQGHAGYNYIPTLASSPYLYFVSLSSSLAHSLAPQPRSPRRFTISPCPLLFWRGANCKAQSFSAVTIAGNTQGNRERHESNPIFLRHLLRFAAFHFFFFSPPFNYLSLANSIDIISRGLYFSNFRDIRILFLFSTSFVNSYIFDDISYVSSN